MDDSSLAGHDELLVLAVALTVDAVGEEGVKEMIFAAVVRSRRERKGFGGSQ